MHALGGDCGASWLEEYDMDACCVPLVGDPPPHPHDSISSVLDLRLEAGTSATDSDSGLSGDSWGVFGAPVSCCCSTDRPLMELPAANAQLPQGISEVLDLRGRVIAHNMSCQEGTEV